VQLGVEDLDTCRRLDVSRGHVGRALRPQVRGHGLFDFGGDHDLLQVQDDVSDVLGNLGDRRELVQDTVDLDRADGRAGDRAEQRPAQRVAERVAEARLQRLDGELRARGGENLFLDLGSSDDQHVELPPWRRIIRFCSAS